MHLSEKDIDIILFYRCGKGSERLNSLSTDTQMMSKDVRIATQGIELQMMQFIEQLPCTEALFWLIYIHTSMI